MHRAPHFIWAHAKIQSGDWSLVYIQQRQRQGDNSNESTKPAEKYLQTSDQAREDSGCTIVQAHGVGGAIPQVRRCGVWEIIEFRLIHNFNMIDDINTVGNILLHHA